MRAPTLEVRFESDVLSSEFVKIARLTGHEKISQLYRFEVLVVATDGVAVDVTSLLGSAAALLFVQDGSEVRRIYATVSEAIDTLDPSTRFPTYRLTLVPRLHRLTLVETQEIYLDATITDIIKAKMALVGLDDTRDFEFRLMREYPKAEFVVQYRETDLAFINRLTEHLGISYFFEHTGDRDKIVFTDHKDGFRPIEGGEKVAWRQVEPYAAGVYKLDIKAKIVPSVFVCADYNYEQPLVDLTSTVEIQGGFGGGVIEWGTHFKTPSEGLSFAQIRAEERSLEAMTMQGESGVASLAAGAPVQIVDHPRLSHAGVLLVEVKHQLVQIVGGQSGEGQPSYTNTFFATPSNMTYRPPRITKRPRIYGLTHGIVESAPGVDVEHAWIDSAGRYLVRVLFDTAASPERKASLPIRMIQPHSGPNYGIHFPLRPGTEVLLAFVDGDPDRPLIVGSAPNAVTPSPVFDAEPTLHRIRTSSGVLVEIDDGV
ncbi:MAG: type VI secretion system tip protein TssI/VgrG [Polyangiaceae bacterium]